jgi:DNA adenine methylase
MQGMDPASTNQTTEARPFLRWVGGKRWLVPQLPQILGNLDFKTYHEPFLGGGSAFLGLSRGGRSFLSDLNAELIDTYVQVRDDPRGVTRELKQHKYIEEYYYLLRAAKPEQPSARAARFIFLNHTSYNGIFRVNLRGEYNVPFGRRTPIIPTEQDLLAVSARLQKAAMYPADFAECLENVSPGDLVFLDPPYTVSHNYNGFVKYNQKLFSWEDQMRLSEVVDAIKRKDAYYILTNAAHPSIAELFDKGDWRIVTSRRNAIGGRSASRGTATEYMFTNMSTS